MTCACGALAPAAYASLGVPTGGSLPYYTMGGFEQATGGGDNGTLAGEQGGGFRHVAWSGIALDGSDPGSTVIEPGHVVALSPSRMQPWGLEVGPQVAVANDSFASVNSHAAGLFGSPAWAPFDGVTAEMQIVAPAGQASSPIPAQTRGLGVMFENVQAANTTGIEYYNGDIPLGQVYAPVGSTSFAGLLFPDPVVTSVVITLGSAAIFDFDGTSATPGGTDPSTLVAGDDIVLAEPGPKLTATAGVTISPVLDTFTNTGSTATATIDWGDGTRTVGTIVPAGAGTFNVTGSHAYAVAGTYNATVTVNDFSGDQQSSETVIEVAPRATATSLACSPSPVAVTASTTCTAIVSDAGGADPITPTGNVGVSSPTVGASFADDAGCVLGATQTPGVAICQVQFTPSQLPPVQDRIEAAYDGDGAHTGSGATTIVGVRPQRCTLKALSSRLKGHPAVLGVLVTCDARANVTISGTATAARKGSLKAFSVQFGSLRATVEAGRPTVLVLKPPQDAVRAVRAATGRHRRVSLKLTLIATSHATRSTTTTRVPALRVR